VATCRQSPDLHKPAIVELLLLIYSFQSGLLSVQRPRPASPAHFRHSHIPELICGVHSSIDVHTVVQSARIWWSRWEMDADHSVLVSSCRCRRQLP